MVSPALMTIFSCLDHVTVRVDDRKIQRLAQLGRMRLLDLVISHRLFLCFAVSVEPCSINYSGGNCSGGLPHSLHHHGLAVGVIDDAL